MLNSFQAVNGAEWLKVVFGLLLSTFGGFSLGWGIAKLIESIFKYQDRRKTNKFFRNAQVGGAAAMAFMHGAQDGQKFIGVFLIGMALAKGQGWKRLFEIPIWLMLFAQQSWRFGTSIGGYRIIKAVGMDMVKLETYQGFSAVSQPHSRSSQPPCLRLTCLYDAHENYRHHGGWRRETHPLGKLGRCSRDGVGCSLFRAAVCLATL